jgi:D-3-phosphoglycerate dehydrogenase
MKILHLEYSQYPDSAIKLLQELGDVTEGICANQEELYAELKENQFDVIFTRLGLYFDKVCFESQHNLKFLVTSTTGLNHIDIDGAKFHGVEVLSLKGESDFLSNVRSTAEHTWALLLATIRNFRGAIQNTLEGKWDRTPFLSDELDGKTLGIIGYGRLGKIVANYGLAFNMKVIVHDRNYMSETSIGNIKVERLTSLLNKADYVLLMISYSSENIHFMNMDKFNQMKPGAFFINTSRGELVCEPDLLAQLKSGLIKGAGLDVLNGDSKWANIVEGSIDLMEYAKNHTNLIITPHMGGYGKESIAKTRQFVTEKLIRAIK